MPWETIGTVSPDFDWQYFNELPIVSDLFRVTMSYDVANPGKLLFASEFASAATAEYFTVHPNTYPQVFDSILSPSMIAYTSGLRLIKCKVTARSRLPINLNWQVTLEAWSQA